MSKFEKFVSYSNLEEFWKRITKKYDKKIEDITNRVEILETKKLHKLTFGSDKNYVYDGSEDVTVPVYNGEYEE